MDFLSLNHQRSPYDILEKQNYEESGEISGSPGVGGVGKNRWGTVISGAVKNTLYDGGYMPLYICANPQNVQH